MQLVKVHIQNFRGIEDLTLSLNPNFNLIVGENGSGKTAILEALSVAMGAFFLGFPGIPSRGIRDDDIRYFKTIEGSYEWASVTKVEVIKGLVENIKPDLLFPEQKSLECTWYKEREGITGKTKHGLQSQIKFLSQEVNRAIRTEGRKIYIDLPVLAYYSTARLWKEGRENAIDEDKKTYGLPSRYRGYKDALEIKSTFTIMLDWFKSKFRDQVAHNETSFQLECVKHVIISNIPDATNVKWIFDKDKIQTLYIVFNDNREVPFHFLSDGYRNLLAIFADLAYRCVTLNPHFGREANYKSEGVVLIDELDLHLHPSWQKNIISQLKKTFPRIQFVATTHSPFLIQETAEGELFRLQSDGGMNIGGADNYSLEDIAEYIQNVSDPAWSMKKKEMYEVAKEYFYLIDQLVPGKSEQDLNIIREKLNIIGKAYSDNVAYTAFLEQKRFLAEAKL